MNRIPAVLDIENLVDYFQIKIRRNDHIFNFPLWPGSPPLDLVSLVNVLAASTIYTFNGNNYDLPILTLALTGADHQTLKQAGDNIILRRMKWWDFYKLYNIEPPAYIDHVDLFDTAPGVNLGLKMYMARMHAEQIQDLPVDPMAPVPAGLRASISMYCDNDLAGTDMLRTKLHERLALREAIGKQYDIDVRSKSDAQIAEAVIKASLPFVPNRRYIPHGFRFRYQPPAYLRYITPEMNDLLHEIAHSDFEVTDKEEALQLGYEDIKTGVQIPATLKGRDIRIGRAKYRMGIGGLHSQESSVAYRSIPGVNKIIDIDVRSYYPSLILSLGMYPEQLGPMFLENYRNIYTRRLEAKSEASKLIDLGLLDEGKRLQVESDGLKIVLNGTFGKLFSKYSIFYAPEFGIATTVTGQLALLMLIEMMEACGITVISANTDGIVCNVPCALEGIMRSNVAWWERTTGLEMEDTEYRAIYMRDVNNYVAITTKGKAKRKGVFGESGLLAGPAGKHPDKDICAEAVVEYLLHGTPVENTISECHDIRKFLQVRQVKGGAIDLPEGVAINDGKYLGKVIRWYHSGRPGYIGISGTGDKVAGSEGATPIMRLPAAFPHDVDYAYYVRVANEMLSNIGAK